MSEYKLTFPDLRTIRLFLMGHKDFATEEEWMAKQILELDPTETMFHVEKNPNNLFLIWDVKAWQDKTSRNAAWQKVNEEIAAKKEVVKVSDDKRSLGIAAIIKGAVEKHGMDENIAKGFAARLYDTKNLTAIKKFTEEPIEF